MKKIREKEGNQEFHRFEQQDGKLLGFSMPKGDMSEVDDTFETHHWYNLQRNE